MHGRTRAPRGHFFYAVFAFIAAVAALISAPTLVQASTVPAGAGEPSGDGVDPVLVLSNPSCATLNADNTRFPSITSNWGFKIDGSPNGTFPISSPPGELTGGAPAMPGKSVTISNSDGIYFDWAATLGIDAVIVKGGPNSDAYVYDPEDLADTDLHPPVNPNNDKYYGISHIEFCFDGGDTPPPPTNTDLEIEKTADTASAAPGENVTYTFRVTNNGPADAHGVVVSDTLPAGLAFVSADPRCSFAAGKLDCALGTVKAGQTVSIEAVLRVTASAGSPTAAHDHLWDVQKVEAFQSLGAGQTGEWSLSCPSGYAMVDGSARTDSVDQGTGTVADVETLTSKSSPSDDGSFLFKARNGTSGQAQMHLFGVCLADRSSATDGHTHGIQLSAPVTRTDSFGPGRSTTTLSCPAGTWAVAPGYRRLSGSGDQYMSESSADGSSWTFGFDGAAAGQVETSVRCLDEETTTDAGHSQLLELRHVHAYPTVAPGDLSSSQPYSDQRVSCGDLEKGIVATFELPPGVTGHGNTPEPKIRDFRVLNASGQAKQVHLDLLCLNVRSHSGGGGEDSVANTACVHGDENDTDSGNDCSTHVLAVSSEPPVVETPGVAAYSGPAELEKNSLLVEIECAGDTACSDTAALSTRIKGRRLPLGKKSFNVGAGKAATLEFELKKKQKRKLRKARYVNVDLAKGEDAKLRLER